MFGFKAGESGATVKLSKVGNPWDVELVYLKEGDTWKPYTIDTVITGDDVLPYLDGSYYWVYFSSIVVHPDYRQHGVATEMLLHWLDLILRLAAERNIFFKKIVADAVSDVGVHLLSELGFAFVKPSMHESKIMALDLFKKNEVQTKFNDRLLAVYKKYSEKEGRSNVV